jgi:hypothetical protein
MSELKPLKPIGDETAKEEKKVEKPIEKVQEKPAEKVEVSNDLLKKVNGEWCFELEYPNGKLVVTLERCKRQIPAFKDMTIDQQQTFLEQAAIFGANPFGANPDIFPVPFEVDGKIIYAPVIYYGKVIEKAAESRYYDGYESGVCVETKDGQLIDRIGQVILSTDKLTGGWCKTYIKNLRVPIHRSVNLVEFEKRKKDGTLTKFWKNSPAGMIEKVAISNCLKIACRMPNFYIAEELPVIDIEHEDLTAQKAISANNEEFFNKK